MLNESTLLCLAIAVQVFGLAAMLVYRMERLIHPRLAGAIFTAALVMLVASTALTFCFQEGGWLTSGIVLCLMAVGGTMEITPQPTTF